MKTVTLFHWTAPTTTHLGSILAEGKIRTTESNLSFATRNAGPPVVWLTTSRNLDYATWMGDVDLKTGARLTVEVPDSEAMPWSDWAVANGMSFSDAKALGDDGGDPETWWVLPRPIHRQSISHLGIREVLLGDHRVPHAQFSGAALLRLFKSDKARRNLNLPQMTVVQR